MLHGDRVSAKATFKKAIKAREAKIGRKLTFAEKREVLKLLNGKENLRPMLGVYNGSKQNDLAEDWLARNTTINKSVHSD